jgi:hypothetical protein
MVEIQMKIIFPIKHMAKNLASKLRTGAMVGLAALAVSAPMKAKAGVIYDSGLQTVTNNLSSGKYLKLDYQQTIEDVDTNGDGILDSYLSKTYVKNRSDGLSLQDSSFWAMNMNADLAGCGVTGLTNFYGDWHYEQNGENMSRMIINEDGTGIWPGTGEPMIPTTSDTFYYTIPTNQVIGWENVGASMVANAGAVSFGFQAPKAIPEPTTMGALLTGAAALLAGRRIRNSYKQAA